MEKHESDDESNTCDRAQTNPQESYRLREQQILECLLHATQCKDENCRRENCQKMKGLIQHAKDCRQRSTDGCKRCKQLLVLSYRHAKNCQEANCAISYCTRIRTRLENHRLQQAQISGRRVATMQNREMSGAVLQTCPGNSNSSSQPSSGAQTHSSPQPPQPGIGMESTTGPPVGASQAMPNLGGMQRPTQAWQHLIQTLKSPPSAQQAEQVFAILKSNPQFMVTLFRARVAKQNRKRKRQQGLQQPTRGPPGFQLVWSYGGVQRPAKEWQQILQALKSLALYMKRVSSNK